METFISILVFILSGWLAVSCDLLIIALTSMRDTRKATININDRLNIFQHQQTFVQHPRASMAHALLSILQPRACVPLAGVITVSLCCFFFFFFFMFMCSYLSRIVIIKYKCRFA